MVALSSRRRDLVTRLQRSPLYCSVCTAAVLLASGAPGGASAFSGCAAPPADLRPHDDSFAMLQVLRTPATTAMVESRESATAVESVQLAPKEVKPSTLIQRAALKTSSTLQESKVGRGQKKAKKINKAWSLVRGLTRMAGFARAAYARDRKQASLLAISANAAASAGAEAHSSSGAQVQGWCEDFDSTKRFKKWACSSLLCSRSICAHAGLAKDCCPYTCGLCSGLHMDCQKAGCAAGRRWPESTDGKTYINYLFQGVPETIIRSFEKATAAWEENSCIKFNRDVGMPRILVTYTPGARACTCLPVGYPGPGKETHVDVGCVNGNDMADTRLIVHELGHALGMNHIHRRPDVWDQYRNHGPYLRMFWANLNPIYKNEFAPDASSYIGSESTGFQPYDFESIMHYGAYSTSGNGQPVYDTIGGPAIKEMGLLASISKGDWQKLNDMYNCKGKFIEHGLQGLSNWKPSQFDHVDEVKRECVDDQKYRDPEQHLPCHSWSNMVCQPTRSWTGKNYSEELQRNCTLSCKACDLFPATNWAAICQDNPDYRDPEFGEGCSMWSDFTCVPSEEWANENYAPELIKNCPAACSVCPGVPALEQQADCSDDPAYRDPEFGEGCTGWASWDCIPSEDFTGVDYADDLKANCRKVCQMC